MTRLISTLILFGFLLLTSCIQDSKEQILLEGMEFVKAGNQKGAIIFFKRALTKDPDYLEARLQLGKAYLRLGKFALAEPEFDAAQIQALTSRDAALRLVQNYLLINKPDKALVLLASLEESSPGDVEVLVTMAKSYAWKGNYSTSEKKLRLALSIEPANLKARLGLVQLLFFTNRVDAGRRLLKSIIVENPGQTAPYYLQFRFALEKGDSESTTILLQRIYQIDPNDMGAAYLLGLIYLEAADIAAVRSLVAAIRVENKEPSVPLRLESLADYQQGDYEQALTGLKASIAEIPDFTGHYFTGMTFYKLRRYEQALDSFQKALGKAPGHEATQLMLAHTFLKLGRIEECLGTAQMILRFNSRSALAHNILGSAYLKQGNYDQALSHFDASLQLDPELAMAYRKRGEFNLAFGAYRKGEADLHHAVEAAPEVLNPRLLLALYYLKVHNYPQALKIMQEGLGAAPERAIFYNNMAASYFGLKQVDEAVASLQKAKSLKPDFLAPYFNLASYYLGRHDYAAAAMEYEQALKSVPKNLPATLKLAGLYELTGDTEQALNYYQQASNSGVASATLAYAGYLSRTGEQNKALELLQAGSAAHPEDPNLTRTLALALQADDHFDAASSAFQRLEEIAPGNGLPLLVEAHLSRGDVAAASEIAGRVIAEYPSAEYGYLLQALIHEQRREWPEVEANLKRGIDACELDLNLQLKLANVYAVQRKDQQALQVYDKILLSRPQYVPAIFGKGMISDVQGNKRKAYELYQTVLALDGEYAPALNNLAYLYVDFFGDPEEALRLAIKAFSIQPENPDFLDTLGFTLLKKGQHEKALLFLQKAARLKPHEATIQAHLAEAVKAAAKSSGGGSATAPAGSAQ